MSFAHEKLTRTLAPLIILLAAVVLGGYFAPYAESEPEDDLSDNEFCLDCHIDEEPLGLIEVGGVRVHSPDDGSLIQEAHTEVACIDCHMDIQELPHREDVERTVDCLACHESTPE